MAFAREIFQYIKNDIPFQRANNEKDSHYTTIGDTLVRISDHCTWMYVWDNFLEQNPKHKGKPIVSIVFENSGDTFSEECLILKRFRRNPIKVNEFVFPLHGNAQYLSKQDVQTIINGLKGLQNSTSFIDQTGKSNHEIRVSQNPPSGATTSGQTKSDINQVNANVQQMKENISKRKHVIRLNKSQLFRIIRESVKKALKYNA